MGDFFDERTDDEILANRKTVQLYPQKLLFILDSVLDGDLLRFGKLLDAILRYSISAADDDAIDKNDDPITWSAFQQYKYELDEDTSRYLSKSRKNAANGHAGGTSKSERYHSQANATDGSEKKRTNPSTGIGSGHGHGHGYGRSKNEFLDMLEREADNNDE